MRSEWRRFWRRHSADSESISDLQRQLSDEMLIEHLMCFCGRFQRKAGTHRSIRRFSAQ
jgi:hypothetical protein